MKLLIILILAVAIVSSANIKGRIINGHEADKDAAPFIVSLKKDSHFCAGSIIDEHWVLTASHCLVLYEDFDIIAGLYQLNNESEVQIRYVANKDYQIIHENYTGEVAPYDVGLIYIEKPFDLENTPNVAKIKLPSSKSCSEKAIVYGWGRDINGDIPNILQYLEVDIIDYEECFKAFPADLAEQVNAETNICSFTPDTIDGPCNGDSGGPLVQYTSKGPEQFGIVSWGFIPCATKYPSVYTLTSVYIDWIKEVLENYVPPNVSN